MNQTKEQFIALPAKAKLELLEYAIKSIRLMDVDNPTKDINLDYFINIILEECDLEDYK